METHCNKVTARIKGILQFQLEGSDYKTDCVGISFGIAVRSEIATSHVRSGNTAFFCIALMLSALTSTFIVRWVLPECLSFTSISLYLVDSTFKLRPHLISPLFSLATWSIGFMWFYKKLSSPSVPLVLFHSWSCMSVFAVERLPL